MKWDTIQELKSRDVIKFRKQHPDPWEAAIQADDALHAALIRRQRRLCLIDARQQNEPKCPGCPDLMRDTGGCVPNNRKYSWLRRWFVKRGK